MNSRGIIFLVPLLIVGILTWTTGRVLGQKRICDQYESSGHGHCSYRTGTADLR